VLKGTLGGLLALLMTWLANSLMGKFVFSAEFFDLKYAVAGVAAGAMIGLIGSAFSVGRHLREV
jgi:cell division transport system permease protein